MPKAKHHALKLRHHGLTPIINPVLNIKPYHAIDLKDVIQFAPDATIITSVNALCYIPQNVLKYLAFIPLFVSGTATATAAQKYGFQNILLPKGQASNGIIQQLYAHLPSKSTHPSRCKLLYLTGKPHRSYLETRLEKDYQIRNAEIYHAQPASLKAKMKISLTKQDICAVTLFSSRSAKQAAFLIQSNLKEDHAVTCFSKILAVCISSEVAKIAVSSGFKNVIYSKSESEEAIIKKLVTQLT